jgi:hypothetical protein
MKIVKFIFVAFLVLWVAAASYLIYDLELKTTTDNANINTIATFLNKVTQQAPNAASSTPNVQ